MRKLPFITLSFALSLPLYAQVASGDFIGKMKEVNTFFETIKEPTVAVCPSPTKSTCSLAPFCKQAESNSDTPFLFKSSTGAIPNFVLKESISVAIRECFNQKRDALLSAAETRLKASLAKADTATRTTYANYIASEFDSLVDQSKAKPVPKFSNLAVSKDFAAVRDLKQEGVRQQHWETLMGEVFKPADETAVRNTVDTVRDTMKKWLLEKGSAFAGNGTLNGIETLNIVVETNFDSMSGLCDRSMVAYYNRTGNRMVICPRGASLPAGGLFNVVAHELGHAISPCNDSTQQTPDSTNSWDKVNSCLVNPSSGPGPKTANWKDVREMVAKGRDPAKMEQANDMLNQAEGMNLPYSCLVTGVEPYLKQFGYKALDDQTEETRADWVSSELVQLHSQALKPEDGQMFAMEALSPSILKRGCDLSKNKFVPKIEAAMKVAGCTDTMTAKESMMKDTNGDEHMEPERRFSLLLSTPVIYQSLGCESPGKGCK